MIDVHPSDNRDIKPVCSLCGSSVGDIIPCQGGYVCDCCGERGRNGRDVTTRVAYAEQRAMIEDAKGSRCQTSGDSTTASYHAEKAEHWRDEADDLVQSSLDQTPVLSLGEVVSGQASPIMDTLQAPDVAALDASAHRLDLLRGMGNDCVAMALDAAHSIKAGNSLEKMLAHQLAVAHKTILEITEQAHFQQSVAEKARMLNLAARMMESFQKGLLTLQRLRTNGDQRITVQYVHVTDGGQAVIGNLDKGGGGK